MRALIERAAYALNIPSFSEVSTAPSLFDVADVSSQSRPFFSPLLPDIEREDVVQWDHHSKPPTLREPREFKPLAVHNAEKNGCGPFPSIDQQIVCGHQGNTYGSLSPGCTQQTVRLC